MSDVNKLMNDMQLHNQQLQMIMIQKQSMEIQKREIENALKEIEKSDDDVFKLVGPILVKTSKESIKKELSENKEDINVKVSALQKQEDKIKEKIDENQKSIQGISSEKHKGMGG